MHHNHGDGRQAAAPARRAGALALALVALCAAAALGLCAAAPAGAATPPGRGAPPGVVQSPEPSPAPIADWTVMVYMDGDNNLERWITHDFDTELGVVGSSPEVQVVALADRGQHPIAADGGWTGARVFHVTKGMKATAESAVADWGQIDMGSPQTLVDLIAWTRASYPARHYALYFWDHGWGWWPGYTMHDVTSNDTLDMDEIRDAMQRTAGVDMVGMDTCMGQMIEVEATFRGFARAIAASEDAIGYTGVEYAEVLRKLQERPSMSAFDLAKVTASSYRTGHDKWTLASSAVALDWRWDRLVTQVDLLAWDLRAGLRRHRADYEAAYRHVATTVFGDVTNVDLYDAAYQLRKHVDAAPIKEACTAVMEAVDRAVLYEWSTAAEGRLHGIGIYWPSAPAPPRPGSSSIEWWDFPYYSSELIFTRMTTWEDFLIYWGG